MKRILLAIIALASSCAPTMSPIMRKHVDPACVIGRHKSIDTEEELPNSETMFLECDDGSVWQVEAKRVP